VGLDHLGLEAALRQFATQAASEFGIAVRFKSRGYTNTDLPADVETALFRVTQEALTNVVRHAQATRVDILLRCQSEGVLVMIEDDGVGFEPGRAWHAAHLGLIGMKERAEALGGTLTIESGTGKGTTIVAEVPVANPHSDR
jgi:signal transduction histidine kinase